MSSAKVLFGFHAVGVRLKVAPESTDDAVLQLMNKPSFDVFRRFKKRFQLASKKAGRVAAEGLVGVAANGMGLNGPARTYLQRSTQRSRDRSGMACGQVVPCDGVALPRASQTLLTSITPRPRPAAPGAAAPEAGAAPAAAAAEPAPASNWVRPVAPTPEPAQAPSPPAAAR